MKITITKDLIKEWLLYAIVGVGTTAVSFVMYYFFAYVFHIHSTVANAMAWFCASAYAFFAEKIFVFHSRSFKLLFLAKEFSSFIGMRLGSFVIEIGSFHIFATVLGYNDLIVKAVSGIIVILVNYVVAKFVVFARGRKKYKEEQENKKQEQEKQKQSTRENSNEGNWPAD